MADTQQNYEKLMNEKLLGIDYGKSNIGLAFGRNDLVSPITIISGKDTMTAITEIGRYIYENQIDKVIVGLPLSMEGKETLQSREVRRFVKLLKAKIKKPIEFVNEFRTTQDSKTEVINLGVSKKKRRAVDHLSAALVLKEYYNKL